VSRATRRFGSAATAHLRWREHGRACLLRLLEQQHPPPPLLQLCLTWPQHAEQLPRLSDLLLLRRSEALTRPKRASQLNPAGCAMLDSCAR